MKILSVVFTVSLLFTTLLISAETVTFYVSPSGNNSWSGSIAYPNADQSDGPFATLEHALQSVKALSPNIRKNKITLKIKQGRYELSSPLLFEPQDFGKPLVIEAYSGEHPVISGGKQITGWKFKGNNLWQTKVETDIPFRQLFVNGERRFRARTPNTGHFLIEENPGLDPKARYNTPAHLFRYADGDMSGDWENITDIEVVVLHFWVDTHLPVKSIDDNERIVTFQKSSRRKLTDDYNSSGARYYIDNVYEGMDSPGEWYWDQKTGILSYIAMPGEDITSAEVYVPQCSQLLRLEGDPSANKWIENIQFKNLTFEHTDWQLPADDAGDLQAANTVPGTIYMTGVRNIRFENSIIRHTGTYGIELADGCREIQITNNELADLGAGGIRLSGGDAKSDSLLRTGNITITNNHLHHMGQIYHSGVGIFLQNADNNVIAHNHIHHLYYSGISAGWVWGYTPSVSVNNHIEYNHIHHVGQKMLSDMGGVYLLGISPGTVVRNNRIHDVDSWGYGGWGLYTDEGSTDIVLENNIVYRTKSAGFHQHYGKENIIRNNIFALAREQQIQRSRNEEHLSFTFENNIVYWYGTDLLGKNWKENNYRFNNNHYYRLDGKPVTFAGMSFDDWKKKGQDLNSQLEDPRFTNPDKDDYDLMVDSPAIRNGFSPIDFSAIGNRNWPEPVKEIQYLSKADNSYQPAMFYQPDYDSPRPLLVCLHTWSGDYTQDSQVPQARWCIEKGWIFIHPNFRGPNNRPEATGSDLMIQDILSAVDFAKGIANVDTSRIYLLGNSGGGHASLLMAAKHPGIWTAVSAWVPISDIKAWYYESRDLGNRYADMILNSTGGEPGTSKQVDEEYKNRSSLFFLQNAKGLPLDINAGIHDGHTGSVPVSHTLNAFNVLAADNDKIAKEDIDYIVETQELPDHLKNKCKADIWYGDKTVLLRRQSGNARVTLFEGGHEGLPYPAMKWLEQQKK